MNDDQRDRHVHELVLQRLDGGELGLGLHMPTAASRDPLRRVLQPARRCRRVHGAADRQVHMDAADAGLVHVVELGIRGLLVDDHDAAGALRAELADAVEQGRVIRAINAGLIEDDAVEVQGALQLQQIVDRSYGWGVDAVRREGVTGRIRKDVGVAVAGPARDIEGDWRLGRDRRPGVPAGQDRRGPGRARTRESKHLSARQHSNPPSVLERHVPALVRVKPPSAPLPGGQAAPLACLAAHQSIKAPRAGTGKHEIEENEAIKDGGVALIQHREDAARGV